jgi:hypothetical protein
MAPCCFDLSRLLWLGYQYSEHGDTEGERRQGVLLREVVWGNGDKMSCVTGLAADLVLPLRHFPLCGSEHFSHQCFPEKGNTAAFAGYIPKMYQ